MEYYFRYTYGMAGVVMIGDKIYKFRKSKNLSQEEFANSIGVTRQIVSKWESNQSIPGVDKLKKISDVYEISYSELLNGTDYKTNKKYNVKKYLLLFLLMIIFQVIFILVVSIFSNKEMESNYRCLGTQTYNVLEIYNSDDDNFSYITLEKDGEIKTVKGSKVVSSLIKVDSKYQFIFRSNEDNNDIEYIFNNSEIINIIETTENVDVIVCK